MSRRSATYSSESGLFVAPGTRTPLCRRLASLQIIRISAMRDSHSCRLLQRYTADPDMSRAHRGTSLKS